MTGRASLTAGHRPEDQPRQPSLLLLLNKMVLLFKQKLIYSELVMCHCTKHHEWVCVRAQRTEARGFFQSRVVAGCPQRSLTFT